MNAHKVCRKKARANNKPNRIRQNNQLYGQEKKSNNKKCYFQIYNLLKVGS